MGMALMDKEEEIVIVIRILIACHLLGTGVGNTIWEVVIVMGLVMEPERGKTCMLIRTGSWLRK